MQTSCRYHLRPGPVRKAKSVKGQVHSGAQSVNSTGAWEPRLDYVTVCLFELSNWAPCLVLMLDTATYSSAESDTVLRTHF